MADRPIIFSAPMVRALLAGRKTQTRRFATSPLRRCEPGDRLYVRENFQLLSFGDYLPTKSWPADVRYAATDPCADLPADTRGYPWRPCIHMPRQASRATLIVEGVRIEPLQAISREDAIAEGIELQHTSSCPVIAYATLWNLLHGQGSWAANPNVLVLTFRVERGNIDRIAA